MSLADYEKKRDFTKTDEPEPVKAAKRRKGLRFCVQMHDASRLHYDFRLEWGGVLVSWAVPKGPSYSPRDKRLAVRVEDHPLAYRNFEGTIAQGEYGGGTVMLWDEGTWEPRGEAEEMLESGSLKFTLKGNRLKGDWALVRMKGEDGKNWLLVKEKDEFAGEDDGVSDFVTSVKTGRTLEEIAGGKKRKSNPGKTGAAKKPRGPLPMLKKAESLALTSPDKELYPGVTKKDVYGYYRKAEKRTVPYIRDRLVSLVRCPGGTQGKCFFQKHLDEDLPGIRKVEIREANGGLDEYIAIDGEEGLLSAAQMNGIEFHTWGSQVSSLEKADMLVFDLDPDEGLALDAVRRGLRDLKSILEQRGLTSFLKTSGSKGYHVVVPLSPPADWDKAYDFARNVAREMEEKWPGRYVHGALKELREGKIFIEWLRNARGATSVAPWSLRARDVPAVSCPIAWEEMDEIGPKDITIHNALRRRKDPWKGFFRVRQGI